MFRFRIIDQSSPDSAASQLMQRQAQPIRADPTPPPQETADKTIRRLYGIEPEDLLDNVYEKFFQAFGDRRR